jgi:hypothetical protein
MAIPPLEDLIQAVGASASEDDSRERLRAAINDAARLNELGDELVAHFVAEARRAWCSWAEVGAVLGVSKQAAQRRFG